MNEISPLSNTSKKAPSANRKMNRRRYPDGGRRSIRAAMVADRPSESAVVSATAVFSLGSALFGAPSPEG
jgi:hypothetical protein